MLPEKIYLEIDDLKNHIEKIITEDRKDANAYNDRNLKRKFALVQCVREIYDIINDLREENGK